MYSIHYSPETRILEMKLEGRWSEEDFEKFEKAYVEALRAHSLGGKSIAVLSDSRDFHVQTQEVADRFAKLGSGSGAKVMASAIVVASLLNKMQAERIVHSKKLGVFLDIKEAKAWLADALKDVAA
ncbi:STAS/SEC14 domain-containing protein [Aurantiacibacter gilvus]|uniref:STAS/SEC14 domain-containing protein n=1 Tax=Aurantiacibacter gilvus TaxID=3139141 RepID=A0ABU9IBV7_9SPHN